MLFSVLTGLKLGYYHVMFVVNTRVIQKVSSDGLLRKKTRIYYKPCILPFDVYTVHYFST